MGCCSSRNTLSTEEKLISSQEKLLKIKEKPIQIEMTIKKWIGSEGLSLPRFKKAAFTLGMNIGDNTSPDDPIVLLFNNFKTNEQFNITELIAFCVFLTPAYPEEKAVIWFDIFDSNLRAQLTFGQIEEFLKMIFDFTFKFLPILAIGDQSGQLSSEAVEIYMNTCKINKELFLETYSKKICPEHTLDKETFVDQLRTYYKLTYSDGVRQLLREAINTKTKKK